MAQQKPTLRIAWLSGGLALLVALFIAGVSIPNTGKLVVDRSIHPIRTYFEPQPVLVCEILAVTFIPALCIFLFSKRWIVVEYVGWLILAFLLWGLA
jgi:hypothetical protein